MMKVTIYWSTKDNGLISRIRKRFGISAGITINGETVAEVDEKQLDELMTVQELVDELSKVEDKSKMVQVYSDSVYEDADTITEYDDSIVIW